MRQGAPAAKQTRTAAKVVAVQNPCRIFVGWRKKKISNSHAEQETCATFLEFWYTDIIFSFSFFRSGTSLYWIFHRLEAKSDAPLLITDCTDSRHSQAQK